MIKRLLQYFFSTSFKINMLLFKRFFNTNFRFFYFDVIFVSIFFALLLFLIISLRFDIFLITYYDIIYLYPKLKPFIDSLNFSEDNDLITKYTTKEYKFLDNFYGHSFATLFEIIIIFKHEFLEDTKTNLFPEYFIGYKIAEFNKAYILFYKDIFPERFTEEEIKNLYRKKNFSYSDHNFGFNFHNIVCYFYYEEVCEILAYKDKDLPFHRKLALLFIIVIKIAIETFFLYNVFCPIITYHCLIKDTLNSFLCYILNTFNIVISDITYNAIFNTLYDLTYLLFFYICFLFWMLISNFFFEPKKNLVYERFRNIKNGSQYEIGNLFIDRILHNKRLSISNGKKILYKELTNEDLLILDYIDSNTSYYKFSLSELYKEKYDIVNQEIALHGFNKTYRKFIPVSKFMPKKEVEFHKTKTDLLFIYLCNLGKDIDNIKYKFLCLLLFLFLFIITYFFIVIFYFLFIN